MCKPSTELHLLVHGLKGHHDHSSQLNNRVLFFDYICVQLFFVIFILIYDFSKIIF